MTRYAKRKLIYSLNENFNLLPYVEWDRFVTLTSGMRVSLSYLFIIVCEIGINIFVCYFYFKLLKLMRILVIYVCVHIPFLSGHFLVIFIEISNIFIP
jgi:hypothetical protein